MRVLAVTNLYPRPGHETVAPFNRQQLRALAAEHDLAVVAPVLWTEELRDRWQGRRTPRSYRNDDGIWVTHPLYYYPPKLMAHLYGKFYLASVRPVVERLLGEFRPDVLFSCWAHPDGWATVQMARRAGVPAVVKVVGSDVLVTTSQDARRRRVAEGLRQADGVVAVSHDLARHVANLGVDPAKIHVVYEGINRDLFTPGDRSESRRRLALPEQGRMILFVGNLLLSKGAGVLIEACALLEARQIEFTCYLVGRGRDEVRLRSLVTRHGLEDRVILAGGRGHGELPDWYRSSDVVALPSYSEGIPNVLREASSCGVPYVATRVGGIPEITNETTGELVEPGSAPELAEALERLLATPTLPVATGGTMIPWEESARQLARRLQDAVSQKAQVRERVHVPWKTAAKRQERPDGALADQPKSPRMRVLVITNLYPRPGHETVAPFNRQQLRALAAEHDLAVAAPVLWTEELRDRWQGRRTPRSYRNDDGIWVTHPLYYYPPKLMTHLYGKFYLASVRPVVERLLGEFRPDVLFGCWAHPDGWATVQMARRAGVPAVVKAHGTDVLVTGSQGARRRRLAEGLRQADGVVAVSHDLARHVANLGVDPAKIHVVYNGVDRDLFTPGDRSESRRRLGLSEQGRVILFVGNLLLSKGAGVLIEACARLQARQIEFTCYLVGRGRDENRLRALVTRHGLEERVILVGGRSHGELPDWYRSSDVVALPSYSEGIPNVLREASSCGVPYVATRVGGIPEITNETTGELVEPGSAPELAEALERLLDAPRAWSGAGEMAAISWARSAAQLADYLRMACQARAVPIEPDPGQSTATANANGSRATGISSGSPSLITNDSPKG